MSDIAGDSGFRTWEESHRKGNEIKFLGLQMTLFFANPHVYIFGSAFFFFLCGFHHVYG